MSVCSSQSRFLRGMTRASLVAAFAIAFHACSSLAAAQSLSSVTPGGIEHLSLVAMLDEGLTRARERAGQAEPPDLLTLGSRDTLYLYDMVHGNVRMIATSPNGGLFRRISALRLLAGSWRFEGVSGIGATPRMAPLRARERG